MVYEEASLVDFLVEILVVRAEEQLVEFWVEVLMVE